MYLARVGAGILWTAVLCAADQAAWAQTAPRREVVVQLGDGDPLGPLPKGDLSRIYFHVQDGKWSPHALAAHNDGWHDATVAAKTAAGRVTLEAAISLHGRNKKDPQEKVAYVLDLAVTGDKLAGTYKGTLKGRPREGNCRGAVLPVWPTPVAGFVPLGPGEHPRIWFRKSDLAALRKRAETPEGKAILEMLKQNLERKYSLWHASAAGLLYQITGEQAWADRGRELTEKALAGAANEEMTRYHFHKPGGSKYAKDPEPQKMTAGPSYAAVAMGYDLCYDGWPEDFRKRVATVLQDKLDYMTVHQGKRIMGPDSNHYGLENGGPALVTLAILGDPGTDRTLLDFYARSYERRAKRFFEEGFGEKGWFFQGHWCTVFTLQGSFLPYMQCLRVGYGKDLLKGAPCEEWLFARWAIELVRREGSPCVLHRYGYGKDEYEWGFGWFAEGFGTICPEKYKPAMLWTFQNTVAGGKPLAFEQGYRTDRMVSAFVNWPIGLAAQNPEATLPRVLEERKSGYYLFRNAWKDEDDILVSVLTGADGTVGAGTGTIRAYGLGMSVAFPGIIFLNRTTHFEADQKTGSGVLATVPLDHPRTIHKTGVSSLAVDLSGKSGAAALLVMVGPGGGTAIEPTYNTWNLNKPKPAVLNETWGKNGRSAKATKVAAGGVDYYIVTLQTGAAPEMKPVGDKVAVGGQIVHFDGKKLVLGQ